MIHTFAKERECTSKLKAETYDNMKLLSIIENYDKSICELNVVE